MTDGLEIEIHQVGPVTLDIALRCETAHTLALFGASGSGKTSTLRAIAGLSRPAAGRITVNGSTWFDSAKAIDLPPHRRSVGYVFQEYALFPHLSVLDNVVSAMGHVSVGTRARVGRRLLDRVHLAGLADRLPAELSGGQRQRVALARAVAREPQVLLLDEPFSAVDVGVRTTLYQELIELRRTLATPIVFVTHDFDEVMRFADTVAVVDGGRLVAFGPVNDICSRTDLPILDGRAEPASAFDAIVVAHHKDRRLVELKIGEQCLLAPAIDVAVGMMVRVRVPAREVVLATEIPRGMSIHNRLAGRVDHIVPHGDGSVVTVHVSIGKLVVVARVTHDAIGQLSLSVGSPVFALIKSVAIDAMERAQPDARSSTSTVEVRQ